MTSESEVARIVGRYRHNSPRTIAGEYIIADPNGDNCTRERIASISSGEYPRYTPIGNAFTLCFAFGGSEIFFYGGFLFGGGNLSYQIAFGRKYHKRNSVDGVRASGENRKASMGALYLEVYLGTF